MFNFFHYRETSPRLEFPDSVFAARESLIDRTPWTKRFLLQRAIRHLDAAADKLTVTFQGTRRRLSDVLKAAWTLREDPRTLQVIVHPTWAWHRTGQADLMYHAAKARGQSLLCPCEQGEYVQTADHWRSTFFARMQAILNYSPHCVVVENPAKIQSPVLNMRQHGCVNSYDVGSRHAVGYIEPQSLADYIERTSGWAAGDKTNISGATYKGCPLGFAEQSIAASELGLYLRYSPEENKWPPAESRVLFAMEKTRHYATSRARLGTLLDCEHLFPEKEQRVSHQLTDEHTLVLPQQDEDCMRIVTNNYDTTWA